jgi:hypothetical protein
MDDGERKKKIIRNREERKEGKEKIKNKTITEWKSKVRKKKRRGKIITRRIEVGRSRVRER